MQDFYCADITASQKIPANTTDNLSLVLPVVAGAAVDYKIMYNNKELPSAIIAAVSTILC